MRIAPGRVLDLVASWCQRTQAGDAGELRLFVKDGEIVIEERLVKPRPLILKKRQPARKPEAEPEPDASPAPCVEESDVVHCPRPGCGGTIVKMGDGQGGRCLLCSRPSPQAAKGSDTDDRLVALAAMMAAPPGPIVTLRARPEHWRPDLLDRRLAHRKRGRRR